MRMTTLRTFLVILLGALVFQVLAPTSLAVLVLVVAVAFSRQTALLLFLCSITASTIALILRVMTLTAIII
jgi:hypothetical protein